MGRSGIAVTLMFDEVLRRKVKWKKNGLVFVLKLVSHPVFLSRPFYYHLLQ